MLPEFRAPNGRRESRYQRTAQPTIGAYYRIVCQSAVLIVADVERNLNQITTITERTEVHHEKLTYVQGILDLANAVLTLSVAVISLDTKEITSSIKNLLA